MSQQIDSNLSALGAAAGRLNGLARATGKEVDEQNRHLERINAKVRLQMPFHTTHQLTLLRVRKSMIRLLSIVHGLIDFINALQRPVRRDDRRCKACTLSSAWAFLQSFWILSKNILIASIRFNRCTNHSRCCIHQSPTFPPCGV